MNQVNANDSKKAAGKIRTASGRIGRTGGKMNAKNSARLGRNNQSLKQTAKLPGGFTSAEQYMFPNIVNISVLRGRCTSNCIHCPVGLTKTSKRKMMFGDGEMSLSLFKKIADEISLFGHSTIRLHSIGEPTLWKNLGNALEYAKSKEINVWIFTNAIIRNNHLLEILARNCSIIEVSANSFDSDDFKASKGVDAYEIVKSNIKHMGELIKNEKLATRLIASRVESQDKEYDKNFVDYWKSTGWVSDSFIRSFHNYNNMIDRKVKSQKEGSSACHVHWNRFNVDFDGKAVVCFNELFKGPSPPKDHVIGNLKKQSVQEIWHGKKLSQIREAQLKDDYSAIKFTKKLCCLGCSYCQPLFTKSCTSEYQIKRLTEGSNRKEDSQLGGSITGC